MEKERLPRPVSFVSWMFLVLAGVTVIDFAADARHPGDEIAVIILVGLLYGTAYLCAGLAMMRRRRWGWVLGVLLGMQGVYVGASLLDWWTGLLDPWAHVLPLLYTGGVGIAILLCLLTPASIRFFWGRTAGKVPQATAILPA